MAVCVCVLNTCRCKLYENYGSVLQWSGTEPPRSLRCACISSSPVQHALKEKNSAKKGSDNRHEIQVNKHGFSFSLFRKGNLIDSTHQKNITHFILPTECSFFSAFFSKWTFKFQFSWKYSKTWHSEQSLRRVKESRITVINCLYVRQTYISLWIFPMKSLKEASYAERFIYTAFVKRKKLCWSS